MAKNDDGQPDPGKVGCPSKIFSSISLHDAKHVQGLGETLILKTNELPQASCMLLSAEPLLVSRIQSRINKDKRLSCAIASLNIIQLKPIGYRLKIRANPDRASEVNKKLIWIVRVAIAIVPITEIDFDGDCLSIQALSVISPSVTIPVDGVNDRNLRMSQARQKSLLFDAAIQALADDYTVFLMSPNGRYEDVHFHTGTKSLIPADRLIGKYMHEVISAAAAETVLECLQTTQKTRQAQECYYDIVFAGGERRWYYAKAYPSPTNQPLLLTVKRLK